MFVFAFGFVLFDFGFGFLLGKGKKNNRSGTQSIPRMHILRMGFWI